MPTKTKPQPRIYHFHVTQQLGFKQPILYCWCGASIDLNKQYKPRKKAQMWMDEHEGCEMPREEVSRV
jgi:hypothetical protein